MTNFDLSKLDDASLIQLVESPAQNHKGLQTFNTTVIFVCLVAVTIQNLLGHADTGGFINGILFCLTSLTMLALDQSNRQIKALLQLYKNQQTRMEKTKCGH